MSTNLIDSSTNILQLPDDVLEQIISNIDICHFNQIRNVSKRFSNVVDNFVMHKYQVACLKYNNMDALSYQTAVLNILKFCTEQFWRLDIEIYHHFGGVLLPMLTNFTKYSFPPQLSDVGAFMKIFFEACYNYKYYIHFNACYLQSLLRVLKKFKTAEFQIFNTATSHLRIQVQLPGFYLKQIKKEIKRSRCRKNDPFDLLTILAELLCADIRKYDYNHVLVYEKCLYQYGRKLNSTKCQSTVVFDIHVNASTVYKHFLQEYMKFLETDDYIHLNWHEDQPNEKIGMIINCKSNNYRLFFVHKQNLLFGFNDPFSNQIKV